MDVISLNKLVAFYQKKGILNTMEDRKRVKKDIVKAKHFNAVLICLDADQEIPSSPESYDVCFYVIDGSGAFTVGSEKVYLSCGNMIFAPANTPRGIKSKERLVLLGIQEPH